MKNLKSVMIGIVVLIALIVYPKVFGIYYTNVLVLFGVYSLYAVALNLLLGYTGLLSFGHAMFFGVGAYGTALALTHIEGLPIFPAIFAGFSASIILALILSPLLVRVSGTAFSMLTLAFGMLMHTLCLKLRFITGGEDGIGGFDIPPFHIPGIFSIDLTVPENFYYFGMTFLIICIWAIWFFTKTPFGRIIVSVRDNAMRVDFMGFRVTQTKAVIFLISGGFAGIAGSIYALFQNLVAADGVFGIMASFIPIMMIMVGGVSHFAGPIVGTAFFTVLEEVSSRYTERVELVMGLILIFFILFAPLGITRLYEVLKERWISREKTI